MQAASGAPALERGAETRLARAARGAGRLLGRLDLLTARIPPWAVLGPLVVAGWLVVAYVAHAAVHTGWLYYNGGDASWYYTTAWTLAHGQLPYSAIGYGYSMVLAPFARIAGPSMLAGLPYAIVFNAVVLGPIALLCVYGIAKLIAGRRFAYLVSTLWVLAPLLAIPYFTLNYHFRYVGEQLPALLGLTTLGDFPSMVLLLVAGYFALRTISGGRGVDALTSGLAAGLAIGVKPSNGTFLPALLLGLLVARRPRACLLAAAGLVPSLLCLALWKDRGLGHIPLLYLPSRTLALGAGPGPLGLSVHLNHYLRFNWHVLTHNIDGLREFTWSKRMIEWSLVGGAIALVRRSLAGAAFVVAWLAAYVLLKGGSVATFTGGNFFRYLSPAFPAAFLLATSLPLLLPIAGRKLAAAGDANTWPLSERARRGVLGAGAFLSIAPLLPILALPQQSTPTAVTLPLQSLFVPANTFALHASASGGAVRLSWPSQSSNGSRVTYEIFRSNADLLTCQRPEGSIVCAYPTDPTHAVEAPNWVDRPPPGKWVYRVVVVAGVPPPATIGDAILLSSPLTVELRS